MAFRKIDLQQLETDIADIQDPLVLLNHGQSGNNTRDLGFIMERGSYDNVGIIWDESSDEFALVTTTDSGATVGNVTISSYSNLQAGTVTASSFVGPLTGNADTATALATARNISGKSFDGTSDITIASTDLSDTSNLVRNNQNNTITSTTAGSSAAPEFELFRDITGSDANYIGQIKFSADNDANQKTVFANITGKIGDASDGSEDGIIEIAHQKAGSNNINVRMTSTEFKIMNGTDFDIETHNGSSSGLRLNNTLVTATASEINELSGVTSNIQTQLDDKLSSSGGTISNNLTVTGNLTVNGVTTTVNSTVVEIADPIMTLGSDASDDNKDRGIAFKWNSGGNTKVGFFGYDDSDGKFSFITDGNITSEITSGTLGTIKVGGIDLDGTTITATGTELNYVDGVTSNIQTQIDGKQSPLTHNENSSPYVITTSDAANNSSSTLAISASTLGFNLTGAISYTIFINRLYLRSSEVSVNTNNGTLTFSTGILDDSDEIDAVWIT